MMGIHSKRRVETSVITIDGAAVSKKIWIHKILWFMVCFSCNFSCKVQDALSGVLGQAQAAKSSRSEGLDVETEANCKLR